MKAKRKMVQVFEVAGKEFIDQQQAEIYEKELNELLSHRFYDIVCKPDLTEGRGYYSRITVAVPNTYNKNLLIHFLVVTFGKPMEFVQGVSPIDNWCISKEYDFDDIKKLSAFLHEKVRCGIGDYVKQMRREVHIVDGHGKEVENKTLQELLAEETNK